MAARLGRMAIRIGLIWLVLTVMFEFGFGHFVAHIRAGRVWPAILLGRVRTIPVLPFKVGIITVIERLLWES